MDYHQRHQNNSWSWRCPRMSFWPLKWPIFVLWCYLVCWWHWSTIKPDGILWFFRPASVNWNTDVRKEEEGQLYGNNRLRYKGIFCSFFFDNFFSVFLEWLNLVLILFFLLTSKDSIWKRFVNKLSFFVQEMSRIYVYTSDKFPKVEIFYFQ